MLAIRQELPSGLGLVRDVIQAPSEETMHRGLEALNEAGPVVDAIAAGLEALTTSSRRCAVLVDAADVFLVENVAVLGELTQRLVIEQLAEVSAEISASLPKRLKARRKALQKKAATKLAAEENYPAGGFSSISNSGSLENLVISELIYMNDPDDEDSSDGVDLFDLRYAEGELLYYTRDDAVFMRDQRAIQIVLMPDLVAARVKDAGMRWQRIIAVLGLVVCAVERLTDWLGAEHGLHIDIAFVGSEDGAPLQSEQGILELLVHEWIERGVVEVHAVPSLEGAIAELEERYVGVETDLVVMTAGDSAIESSQAASVCPRRSQRPKTTSHLEASTHYPCLAR